MKRSRALDALDLFEEETKKLHELCRLWKTTEPRLGMEDDKIVSMQFEHGTVGKLLLRHGAIYLAAMENILAALTTAGPRTLVGQLAERSERIRPMLDEMDYLSRELNAIWTLTPPFVTAVERLSDYLRGSGSIDTDAAGTVIGDVGLALGPQRKRLRTAKFVVKHAPTHPGPPRWYNRLGPIVRAHTVYDRMRGCPSENSTNWCDAKLAHKFKPRTERKTA